MAFGSTRRARRAAEDDETLRALVAAGTPAVTIFGKTWDLHVRDVLRVPEEENLAMIADSVSFLKSKVGEVFYDAEHFFDGCRSNREYALATLEAAARAGADCLVLCDTNGGMVTAELVELGAPGAPPPAARRARHPRAQRRRDGRRQQRRRRGRRLHPGARHGQRLRRALRQRQPLLDRPDPPAQARPALRPPRKPAAAAGALALRVGAGEHAPLEAPALRRRLGVRAQGRRARQRDPARTR